MERMVSDPKRARTDRDILDLPQCILFDIFSSLSYRDRLRNAKLTCKTFSDVLTRASDSEMRGSFRGIDGDSMEANDFMKRIQVILETNNEGAWRNMWQHVGRHVTRLTLTLQVLDTAKSAEQCKELLSRFGQGGSITHLTLDFDILNTSSRYPKFGPENTYNKFHVRDLTVNARYQNPDPFIHGVSVDVSPLFQFLHKLLNLAEIESMLFSSVVCDGDQEAFDYHDIMAVFRSEDAPGFHQCFTGLQSLVFSCENMYIGDGQLVLPQNLRVFKLINCSAKELGSCTRIVSRLQDLNNLVELTLPVSNRNEGFTHDDVVGVIQMNSASLRSLHLYKRGSTTIVTPAPLSKSFITAICAIESLRELRLDFEYESGKDLLDWLSVANCAPVIEVLGIHHNYSDVIVHPGFQRFINLRQLQLYGVCKVFEVLEFMTEWPEKRPLRLDCTIHTVNQAKGKVLALNDEMERRRPYLTCSFDAFLKNDLMVRSREKEKNDEIESCN